MTNPEETDYYATTVLQEEMHCTRCGTYLGQYSPGSYGTVPCPKCKEPNVMDYTGEELVVKRRKRARK